MAVRAGSVGGVYRVRDLSERARRLEHVGGISAVGRVQFRGHREPSGAQDPFKPAAGDMAGWRFLVARIAVAKRFVREAHRAAPSFTAFGGSGASGAVEGSAARAAGNARAMVVLAASSATRS